MKKIVEYTHKSIDYGITFETKNGQLMVNATELAKPFGKPVGNFLRLDTTKTYIRELQARYSDVNITNEDVLIINKGNNLNNERQGTWMQEELAIKFAAWLSPIFEVWVYNHIKILLRTGETKISKINSNLLSPIQAHTDPTEQKNNSKLINHKAFIGNGVNSVNNIVSYNINSAVAHTGHTPRQLKSIGWQNGLRGKDISSGKQVVRKLDPATACAMSLTDNVISVSENLNQNDVKRIAKASLSTKEFFNLILGEGLTPHELNQ